MAERRMFSKRIVSSGRFLKMPISTQALYFHLGLNADDDGIVEAYGVLNSTGASEDDLRILVAKGFVYVLNEDLVTYIMDWTENNKIRSDRKIDSVYKDLLIQIIPDVKLIQKRERADRIKPLDYGTSHGQPKDSIGKDRIGKDRIGKDRSDISDADEPPLYQQVINLYHDICISYSKLRAISEERIENIEVLFNDYSIEDFKELFKKAENSSFLKSKKFGFDWLIKPDHMAKTLEGNYDDRPQETGKRTEIVPKWMNKEQHNYDFNSLEESLVCNNPELQKRAEELKRSLSGE